MPYSETSAAPVENLRTGGVRPLTPVSASSEPEESPAALSDDPITEVPQPAAPAGSSEPENPAVAPPVIGVAIASPETQVPAADQPDSSVAEVNAAAGIELTPPGVNPSDSLNSPAAGDSAAGDLTTEPRTVQLLVPEKIFRPERNSPAVRVTYDDIDLLKILNMEPVPVDAPAHFPEWLRQLDGSTIRIRGFMYPTFEATGLTGFTLARDNGICCFVRQPKIYDIIAVELASGVTSDYIENRPFDVEGIFRIQPEADEKELFRLYRIENARVRR